MKIRRIVLIVAGIVNAACMIVLALLFSIQITAFGMWFYEWQYEANNTYAVVNMEAEDLHEVTRHIIGSLRTQVARDDLQIMTVVGGVPRPFFSEIEIRHMYDVWDMFKIGFAVRKTLAIILALSLLPCLISYFYDKKRAVKHIYYLGKYWKWGAASVLGAFIALALVVSINWVRAWHFFHEILFTNDDWLLDRRVDLLVNIVPYEFFFTMTVVSGAIFVGELVLMLVLGIMAERNTSHIKPH
jgi:integral membrane protein (TIGR01906 family)